METEFSLSELSYNSLKFNSYNKWWKFSWWLHDRLFNRTNRCEVEM